MYKQKYIKYKKKYLDLKNGKNQTNDKINKKEDKINKKEDKINKKEDKINKKKYLDLTNDNLNKKKYLDLKNDKLNKTNDKLNKTNDKLNKTKDKNQIKVKINKKEEEDDARQRVINANGQTYIYDIELNDNNIIHKFILNTKKKNNDDVKVLLKKLDIDVNNVIIKYIDEGNPNIKKNIFNIFIDCYFSDKDMCIIEGDESQMNNEDYKNKIIESLNNNFKKSKSKDNLAFYKIILTENTNIRKQIIFYIYAYINNMYDVSIFVEKIIKMYDSSILNKYNIKVETILPNKNISISRNKYAITKNLNYKIKENEIYTENIDEKDSDEKERMEAQMQTIFLK
jgi:hypothetical protein